LALVAGLLKEFPEGDHLTHLLVDLPRNTEVLADTKTLGNDCDPIQLLDPDGATRAVVLPTAPLIPLLVIQNTGTTSSDILAIYADTPSNPAAGDYLNFDGALLFIHQSGTTWTRLPIGAKCLGINAMGYGFGEGAKAYTESSVAMGASANAHAANATAFGSDAGVSSSGEVGTAIGASTYVNHYGAVALGYRSESGRELETVRSIGASAQAAISEIGWYAVTFDASPYQLRVGNRTNTHCTLAANTAAMFHVDLLARDNAAGNVKAWRFSGIIKRDGSNNTSIVGTPTKDVLGADSGASAWDATVTADDTNEALAVQVTGAAFTGIEWAGRGQLTEIR